MNIRKYNENDNNEIYKLFYDTVHSVNIKDYNLEQVNVWAKENINIQKWCEKFKNSYTLIAEENEDIVGFSNIDPDGYFDMLYVHKNFQDKEVAKTLLNNIEKYSIENNINSIIVYSSITAKSFFEKMGFKTLEKNIVIRENIELPNYLMAKEIG